MRAHCLVDWTHLACGGFSRTHTFFELCGSSICASLSLSSSLIQQPDWFGPAGGRRRPDIVMGWTLELEWCKNMLHINNDIFLHTSRTPKSYFQTLSVDIFLLSKGIRTTLLLSAVLCSQFSPSLLEADSGVFLRETVNTSKGEGGR